MVEPGGSGLWVVMPVYNEAAAVRAVVEEWLPVLRRCAADVTLCVIDDGSTDVTPSVLERLTREHGGLEVVTRTNTGHGRACVYGYRLAIARGARWILQIDSDGQCDAAHFPELWRLRADHPLVFGIRRVRRDGWWRGLVSWLLALGAAAASGIWVRDPNVPYRLMSSTALRQVIDDVPDGVDLANVYVAVALAARARIRWVDIVFRERLAGRSHRRWRSMIRPGLGVMAELVRNRARVRGGGRETSRRRHPRT
jgi:glycosyltransferase involved in cell wall biosynthesis